MTGKGLGNHKSVMRIYEFVYSRIPKKNVVLKVPGEEFRHLQIKLVPENDPYAMTTQLFLQQGFSKESFETNFFCHSIKPGMTVIDVGANTGYYALIASAMVGEAGRVYAFEPEPESYKKLLKNIELNNFSNIIPVDKALTDRTGTIKLFLSKMSPIHSIAEPPECRGEIYVQTVSLDEFLAEDPRVDIIKMDIEGSEILALRGMRRIIESNKSLKIFLEFLPRQFEAAGFTADDYFDLLKGYGFKISLFDEYQKRLLPVEGIEFIRSFMREHSIIYVNMLCQK